MSISGSVNFFFFIFELIFLFLIVPLVKILLLSNELLAVNFLPAEVLLEIALEAESRHKCQDLQSRASLKTNLPSFCSAFFLSYGQFCNSFPLPFHLFVCAEMYTACMYTRIQHVCILSCARQVSLGSAAVFSLRAIKVCFRFPCFV